MAETAQEYIARMLGNLGSKNALAVQRATPAKLAAAIKGLSPAQMRKRPGPEKWSIAEIVGHLRDAEIVLGFRLRMAIAQSGNTLQGFDQNLWAQHGNYIKEDVKQALKEFGALREANHRLLKRISKDAWEHYGMHSERGKETVTHMTRMIAGHDVNHLRQVQDLARKLKSR